MSFFFLIQFLPRSFLLRSVKVHRAAVWILGEYATSVDDIRSVMSKVRQSLGEIPIVDDEIRKAAGDQPAEGGENAQQAGGAHPPTAPSSRLVTADGTYATQSVFSAAVTVVKKDERPPLRKYLMEGDFFIGASLATTLTKLALRFVQQVPNQQVQNQFCAEAMLVIAAILHLGRSGLPQKPISNDDAERLGLCMKVFIFLLFYLFFTDFINEIPFVSGTDGAVARPCGGFHRCLPSFHLPDVGRQSRRGRRRSKESGEE